MLMRRLMPTEALILCQLSAAAPRGVGGRGKVPATGMQENARDESARDVDFPF